MGTQSAARKATTYFNPVFVRCQDAFAGEKVSQDNKIMNTMKPFHIVNLIIFLTDYVKKMQKVFSYYR
jgi:hypothetical protein